MSAKNLKVVSLVQINNLVRMAYLSGCNGYQDLIEQASEKISNDFFSSLPNTLDSGQIEKRSLVYEISTPSTELFNQVGYYTPSIELNHFINQEMLSPITITNTTSQS